MNHKLSARLDKTDVLGETLAAAENIIAFYEVCLDVLTGENYLLEKENRRLKSRLRFPPGKNASPASTRQGTSWRANR